MFPNVQNSQLQVDADSKTSVHANTRKKLAEERENSASIAVHIPSNERPMQVRKIQSDDRTQCRVRLQPREQVRSQKVKGELHLESSRPDL